MCTHPSCILLSNTQSRGQATQSLRVFIFYTVYKTINTVQILYWNYLIVQELNATKVKINDTQGAKLKVGLLFALLSQRAAPGLCEHVKVILVLARQRRQGAAHAF